MNKSLDDNMLIKGFTDSDMELQLLRQLGSSAYHAAAIGECFNIAKRIPDGDHKRWVEEFERLAEWQKNDGMERLVKNHVVSGREQLFRASNSYRAAEFYSPAGTEEIHKLGLNAADCFCSAISAMDLHFENHSIPYEHINLPAYFISPANDGVKRQTIMLLSSFDGTMEEEFFYRGFAALERGYNVIVFAGPGSIDVARRYPETSIKPDFEQVVKRIINHFEFRHEINKHNLALMGSGTGAYFALRAACYEQRLKALIINPPIIDLHAYFYNHFTKNAFNISAANDFNIQEVSSIPEAILSTPLKAQTEHFIKRLGQETFLSSFEYLQSFSLADNLDMIKIPCLALIGEQEDLESQQQFEMFCKQVDCESYQFTCDSGASQAGQIGNLSFANAITYDWYDGI